MAGFLISLPPALPENEYRNELKNFPLKGAAKPYHGRHKTRWPKVGLRKKAWKSFLRK